MEALHVGCSGWNYDDWRGVIYPEGLAKNRWLGRYAELFGTVEVNNTFYRLPERHTVAAWAEQVPSGFVFACKASRYLTHVKRLRAIGQGIRRLWGRLEPLREQGKLGPILWQLPESFPCDRDRLAHVLELLARRGGRHAFEFRHPSWFTTETYELLSEAGAALVVADHPERPFSGRVITADWTYVRFHYGRRGRRGNYSDAELAQWRRRIAAWRTRTEVYAYFNNDWEAFAPRDALALAG
jgi:uncharacterized protein YecE (DUF72 family)